jgi:putative membrane protein
MGFLIRTAATAITFAVVAYLLPAIDYGDSIQTLIIVAVIAGLLNGFVKPIIKIFALPLTMATFGLFSVIINAAMLLLIAWVSDLFGVDFVVGGFPPEFGLGAITTALIGGILVSIVGSIVGMVIKD